eukprot:gb/GFBE01025599.1/.p1 GENE.gb/GFBE01025599.1/~~gb/GFBE01025599.1/.p1  ORF type:complete len:396 (+),score=116.73 gb/GFBE01025599.1/:1-1188(+)
MKAAARTTKAALTAALMVALFGGRCFTPSVPRTGRGARASVTMRAGAKTDAIGKAAEELSKAAYPFMTQVDWNSPEYWIPPGADAMTWAKAIATIIDHGSSMDMELVKKGCWAHHDAIKDLPSTGICSEAELTAMNAAIGRMIASAPQEKTMAVYDAVKPLIDPKVAPYLMSKVNEEDAKAAYAALVKFTEVVKANPITPSSPATTVSAGSASSIGEAAGKLAGASYPFMKGIDWLDGLWGQTVPTNPQKTLRAIDKMIVMGAQMDSAALKEAGMAHVKAIQNMDDKAMMTEEDYKAILAGIGKTVASVPAASVMDVYNSMGGLVTSPGIPQHVYGKQNPKDALDAYMAFMEFKDTVRAAQQKDQGITGMFNAEQNAALIGIIVFINVAGVLFMR